MLTVVHGLPGSGKSTWISTVSKADVRLFQSDDTRHLADAVELAAHHVARGRIVALESWGWCFPDQDYPVRRVWFANQPGRCVANVIRDGLDRDYRHSGIRMAALLKQHEHYSPPPESLPVHPGRVTESDVEAFLRLYPSPHGALIRRLLKLEGRACRKSTSV